MFTIWCECLQIVNNVHVYNGLPYSFGLVCLQQLNEEMVEQPNEEVVEQPYEDVVAYQQPYEEVTLDDGRIARRCRADVFCKERYKNFWKILRMEEHLKNHGIEIRVSSIKAGRPKKGEERQKTRDSDSRCGRAT